MRHVVDRLLERSRHDPFALVAVAALVWTLAGVGIVVVLLLMAVVWAWMPWSLALFVVVPVVWVVVDRDR